MLHLRHNAVSALESTLISVAGTAPQLSFQASLKTSITMRTSRSMSFIFTERIFTSGMAITSSCAFFARVVGSPTS